MIAVRNGGIMRGKNNKESWMQILILLGMILFLLYQMVSGKINYFVHPRYHTGIWIGIVLLATFVISMFHELRKGRHNTNLSQFGVYLIPFILLFFLGSSGGAASNIVIAQTNTIPKDKATPIEPMEEDVILETEDILTSWDIGMESKQEESDKSIRYQSEEAGEFVFIDEDFYASWYYDVYDYLEDFKGKKYQFLAQVYYIDELEEDEVLLGRNIMICCAADLTGYGFVSKKGDYDLKEYEFVMVTGTIGEYEYHGSIIPCLTDIVIEKAEAPEFEYVYYNFY